MVPEFSQRLVLLLFMTAALLMVKTFGKKQQSTCMDVTYSLFFYVQTGTCGSKKATIPRKKVDRVGNVPMELAIFRAEVMVE